MLMVEPATAGAEPHYNPIFERLIEESDEDELVGLVAYGIYKRAKRAWASRLWARDKRPPNEDDLRRYVDTWTDDRLEALVVEARSSLADFGASMISEQEPAIREEAVAGEIRKSLAIFLESTKMSWRKFFDDVGLSLLGAFFYIVLLILMVLVFRYAGVDLIDIWQATNR